MRRAYLPHPNISGQVVEPGVAKLTATVTEIDGARTEHHGHFTVVAA